MNRYPRFIKTKLNIAIQKLIEKKEEFVKHPLKDFVRSRKFSPRTLLELLISIGSGSQTKELLEFFKYDKEQPSPSNPTRKQIKTINFTFYEIAKNTRYFSCEMNWQGFKYYYTSRVC